jgi:outer membrane receptor protein involved in Fe transport
MKPCTESKSNQGFDRRECAINFNNLFKIIQIKFSGKNCYAYFSVENTAWTMYWMCSAHLPKTKFQIMRKGLRFSAVILTAIIFSLTTAFAQSTTITGTVRNIATNEGVSAVSVTVRGSSEGTFTDANGGFRLAVKKLPAVLVFSSIGFETQEINVTDGSPVEVSFRPSSTLGQEVVVSATRTAQRILDAPVTVERLNNVTLRNIPAPSYYEAISNLKGVDMHTASLTFRTVTTRGFISSGNNRLNQLIDGMDNQAPGLNFSVGSVIGLTELDVDNIELLSGASSALYGSGGMNGTLLINSKSPFKYQGLSFQVKQGIMHIHDVEQRPSAYYDWSMRWGKAFNDKFAFKISGEYIKAKDWEANDYRNVSRTNVLSKLKGGDRVTDPNFDGINMYGDETSANIGDLIRLMYLGSGSPSLASNVPGQAYTWGFALQNTANQNVSRTGYKERDLVDYNTQNFKVTGGLFWKITPGIEASFNSYFGTGTTVYTGADRYSLRNLKMAQHKLELKASNWFLRGYTTQENAGDAYQATALGRLINEAWKPSFNPANLAASWYPQYIFGYLGYKAAAQAATGVIGSEYGANQFARGIADAGRVLPGTAAFNSIAQSIKGRAIPNGAKFLDRTDLWSAEGQLNFSDQFGFSKAIEVIAGAQWKEYVLNSKGTIFADTAGKLKPAEYGAYIQLRKKLFNDVLTLTAAGRYDDHTNFKGRFTPRIAAVIQVAPNNNIRLSYQTAYRFPTNQDQYINLNTGSAVLIGALPEFQTYWSLNTNPGYTVESINAYRAGGNPANIALLVKASYSEVKPETVSSYEIGYKGLLGKRLFVDAYAYYSKYRDFLGRIAVGQSLVPGNPAGVSNPLSTRNLSYIQNTDQQVKALGWGFSADLQLVRGFFVYGNVYSDKLKDVPTGVVTNFNAPLYRYNIGVRNDNLWKNIGFNFVFKWQDNVYYESTFATGTLPYFGWLDGQVSYRLPKSKSQFRIGGTNLGNRYQRTGFGNPYVGGLYYVSYGYNL